MKIVIIRVKGIGNMVMFTPVLMALRKEFPDANMVFFGDSASAEVIRGSNIIDEIVNFNLDWSLVKKLKVLLSLRKRKFDYSIMTFPAHKWQFNLFAFLLGAKKRVTHAYSVDNLRALDFLQNVKIPAMEQIHDVEQNLNLLKAFDIKEAKDKLQFFISEEDNAFADDYFKENKLNKVIALHVGGSDETAYKRWPDEYFSEVVCLLRRCGYDILFIAGPGEEKVVEGINCSLKDKVLILQNVSLKKTAAVVSKCSGLLCSDSGIGHIAAAVGIPVLSLVGPGDPRRIRPYGKKCAVISGKTPCSPCIHYPFRTSNSRYSKIVCRDLKCLKQIYPEEVKDKLVAMLSGKFG